MNRRNYFGQKTLLLLSLALIAFSAWEASVRLDAMYKPLGMFFHMAVGERIPVSTVMSYFDWTIFEAPVWLLGCMLIGLLSLLLSRSKGGQAALALLCVAAALYGLTRQGSFMTDLWRLVQPALMAVIAALSLLNLFIHPRRKRRASAVSDSPIRMEDAPRLRRIGHKINP